MESKKVNIFAFIMIIVMCVVSIYIGIGKNDSSSNIQADILTIYKKLENLDEKIDNSTGKSAYQLAVENGYSGTEGEWLQSLKGANGTNALANVSVAEIYDAYLTETNQTETDMSYEDFLLYYYSVIEKYDTKSATQLAYSTTVDICYSYYSQVYYIQSNGNSFAVNESLSGLKGGVSAGAGIIYQMLDTEKADGTPGTDGVLDTAYIITNYHVAYIENYSNDSNYTVYANYSSDIFGNVTVNEYFLAEDYTKVDGSIKKLSIDEGIDKHFLVGAGDQYYGIYLYGYQDSQYKVNATFVGGSADNDIAILKVERDNISSELAEVFFDSGNYFEASIGNSSDLVGGEEVIAVGNPLIPNLRSDMTIGQYEQAYVDALVLTSTAGVVSAISDETKFESLIDASQATKMRLIRVDAAINSGNSGGGLYDLYGRLVGIVNSKIASSNYDNVGYAIPVNIAAGIADQVISQCDGVSPSSTNTRIKRLETNNIGFDIENGESNSKVITDSNGKKQWCVSYNILVKNIDEASVSYIAGLRNDDIITSVAFDGITYTASKYFNLDYELRDLLLKVNLTTPKLTLTISRLGETQTVEINLSLQNFIEIC